MDASSWQGVAGKRIVLTGATNGIGLAAAREFHARGANLAIVARNSERAVQALAVIQDGRRGPELDVLFADLSSQRAVRHLASEVLERYPTVDVLINNAGAVFARRVLTVDGIEATWALNHLAPFLLTTLLLERLVASAPSRVITTSSGAHKGARISFEDFDAAGPYHGFRRYGQTKLANILFTAELAERLSGSGVTANCFHPGFVATGFSSNNGLAVKAVTTLARPFARRPEKGAETLVWLADSPDVAAEQGGYFFDKKRVTPSAAARDRGAASLLWTLSEAQTQRSALSA